MDPPRVGLKFRAYSACGYRRTDIVQRLRAYGAVRSIIKNITIQIQICSLPYKYHGCDCDQSERLSNYMLNRFLQEKVIQENHLFLCLCVFAVNGIFISGEKITKIPHQLVSVTSFHFCRLKSLFFIYEQPSQRKYAPMGPTG